MSISKPRNPLRYVYVLKETWTRCWKVGFAVNVSERILELQQGNPRMLCLHTASDQMQYRDALALESYMHELLSKYRQPYGEWFKCHASVIDAAVVEAGIPMKNRKLGDPAFQVQLGRETRMLSCNPDALVFGGSCNT